MKTVVMTRLKLLTTLLAMAIVAGPAHADYLPGAYAGCGEIKPIPGHLNPIYGKRKKQQMKDYKRCLIDTDRVLREDEALEKSKSK